MACECPGSSGSTPVPAFYVRPVRFDIVASIPNSFTKKLLSHWNIAYEKLRTFELMVFFHTCWWKTLTSLEKEVVDNLSSMHIPRGRNSVLPSSERRVLRNFCDNSAGRRRIANNSKAFAEGCLKMLRFENFL